MQEKINFSDYSQIPDDLKQKMQKEDAEKTELILALDKKVQLLQKSNDLQKVIIDSYEAEKKRASTIKTMITTLYCCLKYAIAPSRTYSAICFIVGVPSSSLLI